MPSLIPAIIDSLRPTIDFLTDPEFDALMHDPEVANLALGNPQELPLPDLVSALTGALQPQDKDWFAYKMNEPGSRQAIAAAISARHGVDFAAADIFVTNGGFAAIASSLRAIAGPGDEVVFVSPPWFFYEALIMAVGATPVRVHAAPPEFDLPVDAIAAALTDRTAAVLINSPHNPTGRIYPAEQLQRLASVLAGSGRLIYLLSDEPYNRIVFDGRAFPAPAAHYPATLVLYSFGKTLLSPGMRMGYVALAPGMPEAAQLRERIFMSQVMTGYAFANADLQHALPGLEELSIDVGALQRRRDRLVPALQEMGYEATMPEGTFYVMVKSPVPDDREFARTLQKLGVLVLPGSVVELPGWFRLSLTATDAMVERGLEAFRTALDRVVATA